MGRSNFPPLDNSRDQHVCSDLLDETYIDIQHTLGVHLIRIQFWQCHLCNVYQLWQPDELHQLLLGLVQDLLHWLLKYMKARTVKDQSDYRLPSVPRYPGLKHFFKRLDSMKGICWHGKQIQGMIETLTVICTRILDSSKDDMSKAAETASE